MKLFARHSNGSVADTSQPVGGTDCEFRSANAFLAPDAHFTLMCSVKSIAVMSPWLPGGCDPPAVALRVLAVTLSGDGDGRPDSDWRLAGRGGPRGPSCLDAPFLFRMGAARCPALPRSGSISGPRAAPGWA